MGPPNFHVVQFVATSVVLGLSYTKPCDSPLFLFLCLYGIMLGSNMFVLVHQYQSPYPEGPEARVASRTENAVKTLSEWTDIVAIALYVAGNIWLSGCRTCPKTAPLLFYTSLAWVIWGYFLLLLPVIGLLCIIMCLPCFIVFFQLFYRGGHAAQHGATPEQISRVRAVSFAPGTTKYDEVDIAEDDAQCAICLSEYQAVEQLRVFPCKHHFHQLCVDQWLRISATCPLCVRPAIAEERV